MASLGDRKKNTIQQTGGFPSTLRSEIRTLSFSITESPIAHCAHLKETYDNMKILLEAIQYNIHQWNIYGDLKVVSVLMGIQRSFTKLLLVLCLWDSHSTDKHYIKRD
jgi:hypothetical protein